MSLRVLESGLCTLLVDHGRPWARGLGLPVGGAADRASLALGNALAGNPPDAAALEVCLAGPVVQADDDLGCALFGAPFDVKLDGQPVAAGSAFTLPRGARLRINGTRLGMRVYLCVQGGLDGPIILGSRSSLAPLKTGDVLGCRSGTLAPRFVRPQMKWNQDPGLLRVLPGPQADWFQIDELLGQSFAVLPASNRMGMRLEGKPLTVPQRELVSEPVCPGSVQVTRDGRCIVLGVDGQSIGGYPRIAQVVTADLDKLGQCRPGDAVRFELVNLDQARLLLRARQAEIDEWLLRIRTAEVFG